MPDQTIVDTAGKPYRKTMVYKAETEVKEGERSVVAAITTDAIDRDCEIVLPRGIDRSHYLKNPVVLWAHDYRQPPIGRCMWLKLASGGKEIVAKTQFNKTPMGETVFRLYQEGHLNAFSIGFMVLDWSVPTAKDIEGNPDLEKCRAIIRKSSLLEYSAVPVPSNPEALAREVSKGLMIPEDLRKAIDKEYLALNVPIDTDRWSEPPAEDHGSEVKELEPAADLTEVDTKEVETVEVKEAVAEDIVEPVVEPVAEKTTEVVIDSIVDAILKRIEAKLTPEPVAEPVVEVKETGVVPFADGEFTKSAWDVKSSVKRLKSAASEDGTGDTKSIDFEIYASAFAWYDPAHKTSPSAYKLPHHDLVDGVLTVSREAVEASLKLLDSSESPIPKAYRDQVREHLTSHAKSWETEPAPVEPVIPAHRTRSSIEQSVKRQLENLSPESLASKAKEIAQEQIDRHRGRV